MNLSALVSVLLVNPAIASAFDYNSLVKYTDLIRCLKPTICLLQPSYQTRAPEQLPINIHEFLKVCLSLDDDTANLAWHALRNLAWYQDSDLQFMREAGIKYLQLFLEHGLSRGITFYNMCPPTRVCLDPRCRHPIQGTRDVLRPHELGEASSFPATVFTHEFGPIPGTSTSLYCRKCHTRYYANYYVHEGATTRTYYSGGPFEFLHIAQHVYISSRTCELFATMMVTSWTSATNCARIYNNGLMDDTLTPSLPLVYPKSLVLDVEDVWNAFLLHSLLLDHEERGAILELNHDAPSQGERLRPALRERNSRMVGPGQEEWSHACDLCCWVHEDKDGVTKYLRSTVTDGVTLGHPCCGEHDCQETTHFGLYL